MVQIDRPTRDFIATARVALGVANSLDENEPAKGHLLNALDEAFKILDTREPLGEHFYASVAAAHTALREGIAKAGPLLDVDIVATGHAHTDVAWLWTLGQTRRKSERKLYDFVRQDDPELFEAIKQRGAEENDATRNTHRAIRPLLSVDRPNIVIETVKQAEDGDGVIVRFYESQRQRGPVTLTTGFDLAEAWRTNSLFVKPYEIVTLRPVPA